VPAEPIGPVTADGQMTVHLPSAGSGTSPFSAATAGAAAAAGTAGARADSAAVRWPVAELHRGWSTSIEEAMQRPRRP
jgi:hypothetical protein